MTVDRTVMTKMAACHRMMMNELHSDLLGSVTINTLIIIKYEKYTIAQVISTPKVTCRKIIKMMVVSSMASPTVNSAIGEHNPITKATSMHKGNIQMITRIEQAT